MTTHNTYYCSADEKIRSFDDGYGEPHCEDEDGAGIKCSECPYSRKPKLLHRLKNLFALLTILGTSGTVIALGSDDMTQFAIILAVSILLIVVGAIGVCKAERRLEK